MVAEAQSEQPTQPTVLQSSTGQIVNSPPPTAPTSEGVNDVERKLQQLAESQPSQVEPAQTEAPASQQPSTTQQPSISEEQDLSWLSAPTSEPSTAPAALPDTPEAKKFATDFQQYLGFSVDELRAGIQEMQQMRTHFAQVQTQAAIQRQEKELSEAWGISGDALNDRLSIVRERFSKLPPEMQSRLDNPEGAKMIWARLQQEEQQSGIPVFQRSTGLGMSNAGQKKPQFTRSQIQSLTAQQYERYAPQILQAYQQGLVVDDLS